MPNLTLPWRGSWPQWLARLAVVLAALACLWAAVNVLWSLLEGVDPTSVVVPGSSHNVAESAAPMQVARWHLFGNNQHARLKQDILAARRETELNLVLHGTVARTDAQAGYALIADKHGIERAYRVGDPLADGAKLAAVFADHVVIENDGRREKLSLPRESLDAARRAAAALGTAKVGKSATAATPIYVAPSLTRGRVDWQQARAEIAANPQQMLQQLDIQPVFEGTRMRGVRLGSRANNPLVAAAGLQADDIVTAVNGIPLDSLARGRQLFEQLQGARRIELSILRNGRPQTLSIDLSAAQR